MVKQPFHHQIPVGDRRFEHVQCWDFAEIGIRAGTEAQLVGMSRKPDLDGKYPQLLQHFENSRLRRDRQREQHEVDASASRQFQDVVDLAQLRTAGAGVHRAVIVAIVEYAEHSDIGIILGCKRPDELFPVLVRAHDNGAPIQPTLTGPAPH